MEKKNNFNKFSDEQSSSNNFNNKRSHFYKHKNKIRRDDVHKNTTGNDEAPKSKSDKGFYFLPIGGCSEIGMNLYAYIYNDQWLIIDMGIGFSHNLGQELLIPSPVSIPKDNVKALIITHAHEDHIGAIPYIWPVIKCPIYATNFTSEMIKDKLLEFGLESQVPINTVTLKKEIDLGDFKVEFINVAHSTAEACAVAITTPDGIVVHTGDWRMDDEPVFGASTDEARLREIGEKGVLALMSDSTNVYKKEELANEKIVRDSLIKMVKKQGDKRVIITCFASNVARLESCYLAAKAAGRKLVISGRSLRKIEFIGRKCGYFKGMDDFIDDKDAMEYKPHEILIVCTGSQGERGSSLLKMSTQEHQFLSVNKNDVVIFSSRVIPGNEKPVLKMQGGLVKLGVQLINDSHEYLIHASGHPCYTDILRMYKLLKPNTVIPMHGDVRSLHRQSELALENGIANSVVCFDGDKIKLEKDKCKCVEKIVIDTLAIDGHQILSLNSSVYQDREMLAQNGALFLTCGMHKGTFGVLHLSTFGVFSHADTEMEHMFIEEISQLISDLYTGNDMNKKNLEKAITQITSKKIFDLQGKNPVIAVHFN